MPDVVESLVYICVEHAKVGLPLVGLFHHLPNDQNIILRLVWIGEQLVFCKGAMRVPSMGSVEMSSNPIDLKEAVAAIRGTVGDVSRLPNTA